VVHLTLLTPTDALALWPADPSTISFFLLTFGVANSVFFIDFWHFEQTMLMVYSLERLWLAQRPY